MAAYFRGTVYRPPTGSSPRHPRHADGDRSTRTRSLCSFIPCRFWRAVADHPTPAAGGVPKIARAALDPSPSSPGRRSPRMQGRRHRPRCWPAILRRHGDRLGASSGTPAAFQRFERLPRPSLSAMRSLIDPAQTSNAAILPVVAQRPLPTARWPSTGQDHCGAMLATSSCASASSANDTRAILGCGMRPDLRQHQPSAMSSPCRDVDHRRHRRCAAHPPLAKYRLAAARHLFTVKGNQPTLQATSASCC